MKVFNIVWALKGAEYALIITRNHGEYDTPIGAIGFVLCMAIAVYNGGQLDKQLKSKNESE